jgi:S-adenosylmethionine synthetase
MTAEYVFTSESVTEGHPDKLCDQISDALIDHYLLQDEQARVIAECAVTTGILFVSVKAESTAVVDIPNAARRVILETGYNRGTFNGNTCTIMTNLSEQVSRPSHIDAVSLGDEALDRLAAQDNVTAFGYACTDTPALLPLPIWLAHQLVRQMDTARKQTLKYLTPDGKCQVGIAFRDHAPHRVDSITLIASQQHEAPSSSQLYDDLIEHVVSPVFAAEAIAFNSTTRIAINPEGPVIEGGPALHAGLTGRKNGVDTYGNFSRQSAAALSGKDPTRIDRISTYAARHAAKNIVRASLAERCEVQLSYSIGIAAPVSIRVETFGTGQLADDVITNRAVEHFDFRLGSIIRRFNLRNLVRMHNGRFYRQLAVYGHVGRLDLDLPWEATDDADALR